MSVRFVPEVLADPIGVVVGLIAERKPGLDRSTITCVVEEIAGGRVKRRRLAQALLDRPRVLDDGRSPAPRAVGDLLVALNKAGASRISAPVCAECGKHLRTLQRRPSDRRSNRDVRRYSCNGHRAPLTPVCVISPSVQGTRGRRWRPLRAPLRQEQQ